MKRSLLSLIFLVLGTGCLGTPTQQPLGIDRDASGGSSLEQPWELDTNAAGSLAWRIASDDAPWTQYSGDPPTTCIEIPLGTTGLRLTYSWDRSPQHMWLEARPVADSTSRRTIDGFEPPLDLEIRDPAAGDWYIYGGPATAGGQTTWSLLIAAEGLPGSGERPESLNRCSE